MIVCNKFVFLHLHKSGGTFVNQMMAACIPYARQIGYHFPYHELPCSFRRLPVVGTVRNPWDYYVSWYHFQAQMKQPHPLFMCVSDNKRLGFEQTILNLLKLGQDESLFTQYHQQLPNKFMTQGINLTKQCLLAHKDSDKGFYSFLYERLYHGASAPIIIKMEGLRDGLNSLIEQLQLQPEQRIRAFLRDVPKLNTSVHNNYQSYYSNSLKQAVAKADATTINQHNYVF
ncbi:sulfotransferase domain-containing protein [Thalassotalea sp. PLHSN55]|uniref:sulfotransferase domain-containing protein n=1 Tax=Thalassotalea sp. PLHSN55 TaxID=3435888 RepID=UPI003F8408A3